MDADALDTEGVEQKAYELLAGVPDWVWDGEELPVPIEDIVDSVFGLQVRYVERMSSAPGCEHIPHDQLSGLLLTDVGEIWVNAAEREPFPGRVRFTVGHELGHWTMHRAQQKPGQTLHCRKVEPAGEDSGGEAPEGPGSRKPLPEREADVFAAALLMPEHLIRSNYRRGETDIEAMCESFDCSRKAMNYRIRALRLFE